MGAREVSDNREFKRGLAEKKLARLIDAEIKEASIVATPNATKAREMAKYSGLSERECLGYLQYGRW